jgi:hypothetical protein
LRNESDFWGVGAGPEWHQKLKAQARATMRIALVADSRRSTTTYRFDRTICSLRDSISVFPSQKGGDVLGHFAEQPFS